MYLLEVLEDYSAAYIDCDEGGEFIAISDDSEIIIMDYVTRKTVELIPSFVLSASSWKPYIQDDKNKQLELREVEEILKDGGTVFTSHGTPVTLEHVYCYSSPFTIKYQKRIDNKEMYYKEIPKIK